MRALTVVLSGLWLVACTNGDDVVDDVCQGTTTDEACTLCCRDQGYTADGDFDGDECVCHLQDVGDDPDDIDLR